MSMIFPGMDPYLENPQLWPGLHNRLIVYITDALQPDLQPRYVASIQERVYYEDCIRHLIPDAFIRETASFPPHETAAAVALVDEPLQLTLEDEIHEGYIEIIDLLSGRQVVTVIEVVSPTNKYHGDGRAAYVAKQREVQDSTAHLVEIDLLRAGPYVAAAPEGGVRRLGRFDYLISVNRAHAPRRQRNFEVYLRSVRQPLPKMRIPLAEGDADVRLDLQAVLTQAYDAGRYRELIDYSRSCDPPLTIDDERWARELLAAARSDGG